MGTKSETRELLQRRLETQLKEWSTRIDHLKAEAERDIADAELRERLYARLQRLRETYAVAADKLDELKRSGRAAWRSAKKDFDRLWWDMTNAFDGVTPGRRKAPLRERRDVAPRQSPPLSLRRGSLPVSLRRQPPARDARRER
jgi:hypothetical protein